MPQEVSFRPEQVRPVSSGQPAEVSFRPEQVKPVPATTPPPAPPTGWAGAREKLKRGWEQAAFPGAPLVRPAYEVAKDLVLHPVRNAPLIGGAIGGALGAGTPASLVLAAIGAAGGEAWRQNYETVKSLITGQPPEQPKGFVANMTPPTTTPGGAAISIGREALTSGLLPEAGARGVSRVLQGPLRPPPGTPDAAVAATSKEFNLGLTAGETSSTIPGRAIHGVEKAGNVGVIGHGITEKGRAIGETRGAEVLGKQLDKITGRVSRTEAGTAVNTSAKDAEAILKEQHAKVQWERQRAHGKQEAARRAVHIANQEAALKAHLEAQAEQQIAHEAAEATKAAEFRAGHQATFDTALKAKQAAGREMEAEARRVRTPVSNAEVKAEAQRLIDEELRPPAEAYPIKVPESTEEAAITAHMQSGASVAFDDLGPEAQAILREQAAESGAALPSEINPLEYAGSKVKEHLTRIANAQPTADFNAAWKHYSRLLADSKFLKALKVPGEGQLSALAATLRESLEAAAKASGVDWAKVSAGHATAADASREAARNLSARYRPKKYTAAGFKYPKYKPEEFKADPFTASANLNRMLTEEPSQLLDAFSEKGVVVPERIAAARETLLKTVADRPVVPSQAARNAAAQAEQVRSGVKPGQAGAAASYPTPSPAATPPPASFSPIPPTFGPAAETATVPPRPSGPWDANAAPSLPKAGSPATAPPPAGPSAVQQRGQKAWDQLRTTLVRDQILDGPIHGLQARLHKFGTEGLQELFPGEPQVPGHLQRIAEAFARRGPQAPTWQYRTLEVLTNVGRLGTGVAVATGNVGKAAGLLAGLEGVPAVIAWAAHSRKWTNLLLEGVTSRDTTQVLSSLTRVVEGYKHERKGKANTPPPGPRR